MVFDERPELPRSHSVGGHIGRSGDRGRSRSLVDQGDLPEVVPGPEGRFRLAANTHGRIAVTDDEEAGSTAALARHRLALREAAFLHLVRQVPEIILVELSEDRDLS